MTRGKLTKIINYDKKKICLDILSRITLQKKCFLTRIMR